METARKDFLPVLRDPKANKPPPRDTWLWRLLSRIIKLEESKVQFSYEIRRKTLVHMEKNQLLTSDQASFLPSFYFRNCKISFFFRLSISVCRYRMVLALLMQNVSNNLWLTVSALKKTLLIKLLTFCRILERFVVGKGSCR